MKKMSKLTITPEDSKHEDFTLSLVDYFYKELLNRGIKTNKKSASVEVTLPNKYDNKYHCIIIDCSDGNVYLRGNNCNDKHFGKLSRFNPQRKSDAYNCVNYSVTRLVNRINELFHDLEESDSSTLDARVASYLYLVEPSDDDTSQATIWTTKDSLEEVLDILLDSDDCMDLRDCELVVFDIDDDSSQDVDLSSDDADIDCYEEDIEGWDEFDCLFDDKDWIYLDDDIYCDDCSDCCSCDDMQIITLPDDCECTYIKDDLTAAVKIDDVCFRSTPESQEYYDSHPELAALEQQYGKFYHHSDDDGKNHFVKEVIFPEEENKTWCIMWDSVIEKVFSETHNVERRDIEILPDDALLVLWVQPTPENGFAKKEFYRIKFSGIVDTVITPDGEVYKQLYHPDENRIQFEFAGSKS